GSGLRRLSTALAPHPSRRFASDPFPLPARCRSQGEGQTQSPRTPSPRFSGERVGPIAKQWEGEGLSRESALPATLARSSSLPSWGGWREASGGATTSEWNLASVPAKGQILR